MALPITPPALTYLLLFHSSSVPAVVLSTLLGLIVLIKVINGIKPVKLTCCDLNTECCVLQPPERILAKEILVVSFSTIFLSIDSIQGFTKADYRTLYAIP